MVKKYELPEELGNKLLNYLASKPYIEVVGIIQELQQVKEIKQEKKDA